MKTLVNTMRFGLMICLVLLSVSKANANLEVTASVQIHARADFDAPLATHGTWVDVRTYGRCWRPARVAVEWRPYGDGSWVWTDCGWYWQSDEPWAWACYHYGTWVDDSALGWIWVPDIEWAPAWVYWRTGGGFVGWAPCPPRGVVVTPTAFAFIEVGHFTERVRPSTVIVNNTTIVNKTTQTTEVRREIRNIGGASRLVVVNEGPGGEIIQKSATKKVNAVPIQEIARLTPAPNAVIHQAGQPARKEYPAPAPKHTRRMSRPPSSRSQVPPGGKDNGSENAKTKGEDRGKDKP